MAAGVGPTNSMTKSSRDSASGRLFFLVELGVVKGDLDGCALFGELVQAHAHLVERLPEVLFARYRPAHPQHMLGGVELDPGFFFVRAFGAVGERLGPGIRPQGLERILQLGVGHLGAKGHIAVDMDFEWSVIA